MAQNNRISLPKVEQVGIAVKDLEKTSAYLSSVLEIEPFQILERTGPATAYDKPTVARRKLGLTRIGGMELELIQAMEKGSPYYNFVYSRGEGLQHIRFAPVDNLEKLIARLQGIGFKVLYYSEHSGDCFAYMESEGAKGFIIEVVSRESR